LGPTYKNISDNIPDYISGFFPDVEYDRYRKAVEKNPYEKARWALAFELSSYEEVNRMSWDEFLKGCEAKAIFNEETEKEIEEAKEGGDTSGIGNG